MEFIQEKRDRIEGISYFKIIMDNNIRKLDTRINDFIVKTFSKDLQYVADIEIKEFENSMVAFIKLKDI